MKKLFFLAGIAGLLLTTSSCKKDKDEDNGSSCNNPSTAVPSGLVGAWVNGYGSGTAIVDRYNGQYLGQTWSSARYFKFESNGKNTKFYYTAGSSTENSATYAEGNVEFDAGSTAQSGAFTFRPCYGHYKAWFIERRSLDRDATEEELKNNLTNKYYYVQDGEWLRIEPNRPVQEFSRSFKKTTD